MYAHPIYPWWRKRRWRLFAALGAICLAAATTTAICATDVWLQLIGRPAVPSTVTAVMIHLNWAFATAAAAAAGILSPGRTRRWVLAALGLGVFGFVAYMAATPVAIWVA